MCAKCFHIQYLITLTTTCVRSSVIILTLLMKKLRLNNLARMTQVNMRTLNFNPGRTL